MLCVRCEQNNNKKHGWQRKLALFLRKLDLKMGGHTEPYDLTDVGYPRRLEEEGQVAECEHCQIKFVCVPIKELSWSDRSYLFERKMSRIRSRLH